jgi:16S rRNA processing protein RimM
VVLDDHDSEIGRVVEILETGAHDVMRVVGSHQHLIPFVRGVYVLQVDVIEKRIRVRWEATWGD